MPRLAPASGHIPANPGINRPCAPLYGTRHCLMVCPRYARDKPCGRTGRGPEPRGHDEAPPMAIPVRSPAPGKPGAAALSDNDVFTGAEEARAFAQAIVDTVREPFLVLDKDLRVLAASRSFYSAFKVGPEDTQDKLLYALGDGQWAIPKLHLLLEKIVPEQGVMEGYEVGHDFPGLGHR